MHRSITTVIALGAALPLGAEVTADDRRATGFDEVVIVATKRETGIRDVAADVTVLDADPLGSDDSALLHANVILTLVEGRVVHRSPEERRSR